MKHKTVAARRKARRGRPPKEGVFREPSGRISRADDPPARTATEARARQLGLSVIDAMNPECHTWIGRLHMAYLAWKKRDDGKPQPNLSVSTAQYYASLSYLQIHNNNAKAVQSPGAVYDRVGIWRDQPDDDAHAEFCHRATSALTAVREAIQRAQEDNRTSNLWAALDLVVLRNQELPHMIGDVRILLTAINRHLLKSKG